MERSDRAKQFLPFAAVKGLPEALAAKERVTVPRSELSPEREELLDMKMHEIRKGSVISVIWYNNGEYIKTTGMVARIETTSRLLQIVNIKIPFDDIYDIEI